MKALFFWGLALVMAMPVPLIFAQHGHWIDRYHSASGMSCCGKRDCQQVAARLITSAQYTTMVEVNGLLMELPAKSVHTSEDAAAWWCAQRIDEKLSQENTRCVFLAVGG